MEKIKTRVMTGELSIGTPAGDIPGTVEMHERGAQQAAHRDQGGPVGSSAPASC